MFSLVHSLKLAMVYGPEGMTIDFLKFFSKVLFQATVVMQVLIYGANAFELLWLLGNVTILLGFCISRGIL